MDTYMYTRQVLLPQVTPIHTPVVSTITLYSYCMCRQCIVIYFLLLKHPEVSTVKTCYIATICRVTEHQESSRTFWNAISAVHTYL